MGDRTKVFWVFLCLLGFVLRVFWLPSNLFFGYEQGRDALVVQKIINGKLTLLGPRTGIEGFFHGPFFYYLLTIPYFFSSGSPPAASFFLILLSSLAIPAIYLLGQEMFNKRAGLVAATLYTCSFGGIVASRWLSHPPLVPLLVVLLLLSLLKIVKGKEKYWLLLAVTLALTIHCEVVVTLCLLPAILIFLFSEGTKIKNIPTKGRGSTMFYIGTSSLLLLVLLSSYPLFEFRHNFLMTKSLLAFLKSRLNDSGLEPHSLLKVIEFYLEQFRFFVTPFFGVGTTLFFWGAIVLLLNIREKGFKLLFLWLFMTPLVMLFFSSSALFHHFLSLGPAFILLVSALICFLWQKKLRWLSFSLGLSLLILNLFAWGKFLPENEGVFFQAGQRLFKYSDMLATIDWIYQDAQGENFSLHPFTIPYFSDDAWRYLFSWYGKRKYGYLPKEPTKIFYTIYQPSEGQSWFLNSWLKKEEAQGTKIKEAKFGIIGVEKRKVRSEK